MNDRKQSASRTRLFTVNEPIFRKGGQVEFDGCFIDPRHAVNFPEVLRKLYGEITDKYSEASVPCTGRFIGKNRHLF